MQSFLTSERACGILAHISSLPGPHGIGDIGSASFTFLEFLHRAGQKYWQILPTVPTSLYFDSSPYMSSSAFAGSPLLICPDSLVEMGLLKKSEINVCERFSAYLTDYHQVDKFKRALLERSYRAFSPMQDPLFRQFVKRTPWLKDYAMFMCFKEIHDNQPWTEWQDNLARREPSALAGAEKMYRNRIGFYLFEQYVFFRQWAALKKYAAGKNIRIIGDIPIYVALDSADVWAHQDIFEIDSLSLKPLRVSGVPPDYFSETGQLWGNPLYRWNSGDPLTEKALLNWWTHRFKSMFDLVDVARVDHFRGFQAYWAVPAEEETALNGSWEPGPGPLFFEKIYKKLGELRIIAEDLGEISAEVIKLRDKLGFPGMKVLQFAFDGNPGNPFLPYNYTNPNCVVYTGTHDNDTALGWFLSSQLNENSRAEIKRFANRQMHDASPIQHDLIYLALSSSASLAVIPLQDLLGFGSDCRMNIPGVAEGNWRWRCAKEFLTNDLADQFKELTRRFGRC
jgi:4-alpha-glucanotransferase